MATAPNTVTEHRVMVKPTLGFWCPLRRRFRRGPCWVDYDSGVRQLVQGFQILWNGEVCIFSDDHWKVGVLKVSCADFREILLAWDPEASIEGALSRTTQNPFPRNDIVATSSFLGRPISAPLFLRLGQLMTMDKEPQDIPERVTRLLSWRFDKDIAGTDQLQRIQLLAEWVGGGREARQVRLSWESEAMLHASYKPLVLGFWKRSEIARNGVKGSGGRDETLRRQGGGHESQFLVHDLKGRRQFHGRWQYRIEWVGYEQETWEYEEDVCAELVEKYELRSA